MYRNSIARILPNNLFFRGTLQEKTYYKNKIIAKI